MTLYGYFNVYRPVFIDSSINKSSYKIEIRIEPVTLNMRLKSFKVEIWK